jgi:outer membrane autotransporter protein
VLRQQNDDWYLESRAIPSDVGPPIYQPGTPLYETYPQTLLSLVRLPTLQERVGNRHWSGDGAPAPAEVDADGESSGTDIGKGSPVWVRMEGARSHVEPDVSTIGTQYDLDRAMLQAGVDGTVDEDENGKLIGGLTVQYGSANADVRSMFGDGSISTQGLGVGATLTWYGEDGFYLDGQGKATWFNSDLGSSTIGSLANDNNGFGYALGLEGGARIQINDGLSITPQAQLVYSSVAFDTFSDPHDAMVSPGDGSSLRGRFGVSFDGERQWTDDEGQVQRNHLYAIANANHEFLSGTRVDVSGTSLFDESDAWSGEIGIGGSHDWGDDKYSIYGEMSAATGLSNFGASYELTGTAGLSVKW